MKLYRLLPALLAPMILGCGPSEKPDPSTTPPPVSTNWVLTWSDEFNGANGSAPDPSKWVYDLGSFDGWGNQELQSYTNRRENIAVENGNLVITAIKETTPFTWPGDQPRNYTSARIKTQASFTQATFTQTYGKFEARIKLPAGQGIWPAFWMLGNDVDSPTSWPACGEIDIMEFVGKHPRSVFGTIHLPDANGADSWVGVQKDLTAGSFSDDFHVYGVEWERNVVRWYVDGQLYGTKTSADIPAGSRWVLDHPFFMILNVAVGGDWPGTPDDSIFPQKMLVDYVRVYKRP